MNSRWGRGLINDVAISHDGRRVAVASTTGIYFHDANNLDDITTSIQTTSPVDRVVFSPDSSLIASILPDSGVSIWDAKDGKLVQLLPEDARDIAFSPDGRYLALLSSASEEWVQLWLVESEQKLVELDGSTSLAFSSDSTQYAVATQVDGNYVIEFFDATSHEMIGSFQTNLSSQWKRIASLAFADRDQTLILGVGFYGDFGEVGEIEYRQASTGTILYSIDPITPRGWEPYACDSDFASYEGAPFPTPISIELSSSGQYFSVIYDESSFGNSVLLYRTNDGTLLKRFDDDTNSLAISPAGVHLISGQSDGSLTTWNSTSFQLNQSSTSYSTPILGTAFSTDGEHLAVETRVGVDVYDLDEQKIVERYPGGTKVTYSPNGAYFAVGYENGLVELRDPKHINVINVISDLTAPVENLLFSPNSLQILVTTQDCSNNIYDVATSQFIRSLEDVRFEIEPGGDSESRLRLESVVFNNDGSKIVASLVGHWHPVVWETTTGAFLGSLHKSELVSVSHLISIPNTSLFVGRGGAESSLAISLWNMDTGTIEQEWPTPDFGNYYYGNLDVSNDGSLLVASSNRGTVDFWDLESTALLYSAQLDTFVYRMDYLYESYLAFSPRESQLAVGTPDGLIYIFDYNVASEP